MCGTSNNLSYKEKVEAYRNKIAELKLEYDKRIANAKDELAELVKANSPIHIGDVFASTKSYYKINALNVSSYGIVTVYGCKRNKDGNWSKRNNVFMFALNCLTFELPNNWKKIDNYEEVKNE